MRAIQYQLDIATLLLAGSENVTEDECYPKGFHNFIPAHGSQLSFQDARNEAVSWLNTSFLRDTIEATDQFLGRCLSFFLPFKEQAKVAQPQKT